MLLRIVCALAVAGVVQSTENDKDIEVVMKVMQESIESMEMNMKKSKVSASEMEKKIAKLEKAIADREPCWNSLEMMRKFDATTEALQKKIQNLEDAIRKYEKSGCFLKVRK